MGQSDGLVLDCRDGVAYLSSHHPYGLMYIHALWTGTPKLEFFSFLFVLLLLFSQIHGFAAVRCDELSFDSRGEVA